jgi:hypothetical protein
MLYRGIDQHARQITISQRDANGEVMQARQVSTQPGRINEDASPFLEFTLFLAQFSGRNPPAPLRPDTLGQISQTAVDGTEASSIASLTRSGVADLRAQQI